MKTRIHKIIGSVEETVGLDYLVDRIADGISAGGDGVLRCYVGFEPSGKAHMLVGRCYHYNSRECLMQK